MQLSSIAFFHDIAISLLSFLVSFFLFGKHFVKAIPLLTVSLEASLFGLSTAGILFLYGLYGKSFRYPLSLQILEHTKIVILSCLAYTPLFLLTTQSIEFPSSFLLVLGFVFFSGLLLPRVFYFSFFEKKSRFIQKSYLSDLMEKGSFSSQAPSSLKKNILLIGGGPFLEDLLKACSHENSPYKIIGLIIDTASIKGLEFEEIPVLGDMQSLSSVINTLFQHGIKLDSVFAIDLKSSPETFRFLLKTLDGFKIPLKRLMPTVLKSSFHTDHLSHIFKSLTLEDLLEINHPPFDSESLHQLIHNQRILITGAGGSLGRVLVQKLASLKPEHLSLLDHSEENLLKLDLEAMKHSQNLSRSYLLCDITDKEHLVKIFEQEAPTYVFHLAAVKNVPIAEINPNQAAFTNILGTRNVIEAARSQNVKFVALASSLSCSNPQNISDATKRISEIFFQSSDVAEGITRQGTRFIVCRFDNLIGSSASVTSLFQEEVKCKGPLLLTRPDDERIFMPIKDAAILFLKACILGMSPSQETGHIYEARVSTPVKIKDLADYICLLNGFTPQKEIKYKIIGARKGEETPRHFSSLSMGQPTPYKGLSKTKTSLPEFSSLQNALSELEETTSHNRTQQTIRILHYLVPSYKKQADVPLPAKTD